MRNRKLKALIIDDEQPARTRLAKMLASHEDQIEIIDHAVDGQDGLKKIKEHDPDLLFLDIKMPGMSGFEMLSQLEQIPLTIFCTAYDEYALQAFETNSVDYLLKPIKEERLSKSIAKLEKFKSGLSNNDILNFLSAFEQNENKKELTSITIKTGKKIIMLKLKDIAYFKANTKYVDVFMKNGEQHITEQSLTSLNGQLPGHFKKIQRSLLINADFIKEVHAYFNSRFAFILQDHNKTKLISGRSFQQDIKAWLNI